MRNPRDIRVITPGSLFEVPVYNVDDSGIHSNDEYSDVPPTLLPFCKGVKDNDNMPRQTGYLCETLIEAVVQYLEEVNGQVPSDYTTNAILKGKEMLHWLGARQADRLARGVNQTMKQ